MLTVKQLREVLRNAPGDAPVLVPSHDHGYFSPQAFVTTARYGNDGGWTEDYGEDATPAAIYGKAVTVVVVR